MKKAITFSIDLLSHYPYPYAEPLREALAAYHGVLPHEILPSNGSTELIFLLPRLIHGSRALVIAPAFSEYAKSLEAAGWDVLYHYLSPDDGFELNPDSLKSRLAEGYQLLFLCNPGNPSGRLYTKDEIRQVMEMCRDTGTFLVLDEAFIDFCGEEASMLPDLVASGAALVLRSLTKFYAIPGLRLGYAAVASGICARLADIRGPWSVNTLAQAAGLSALSDSEYRKASRESVVLERSRLFDMLSDIPGLIPCTGAANYLLVRIDSTLSIPVFCSALLNRYGILVRDCSSFKGIESGFIRVAVRSHDENTMLVESIKELLIEYKR